MKIYVDEKYKVKDLFRDLEDKNETFTVLEPPVFDEAVIGYDYTKQSLIYSIDLLLSLIHSISAMGYLDILDMIYHNFSVGIILEYESLKESA